MATRVALHVRSSELAQAGRAAPER
jgi:hypothetical protein